MLTTVISRALRLRFWASLFQACQIKYLWKHILGFNRDSSLNFSHPLSCKLLRRMSESTSLLILGVCNSTGQLKLRLHSLSVRRFWGKGENLLSPSPLGRSDTQARGYRKGVVTKTRNDLQWPTMIYNDLQWPTMIYNDLQWATMTECVIPVMS